MNGLVFHIASGQAFFSGGLLIVTAVGLGASFRLGNLASRLAILSVLIGSIFVVLSSTPLPLFYYALLCTVTVVWAVWQRRKSSQKGIAVACVLLWGTAMLMEIPYHFVPRVSLEPNQSVTILGDSLTAGMGASDGAIQRWPEILADRSQLRIQEFAYPGATVRRLIQKLETESIEGGLIVIELGGNDLLGGQTSKQFGENLDQLLRRLAGSQSQIVMFELPLPPFHAGFGRVQRKLSRKHGVKLIPKRILLDILATEGATSDTIHLTQLGHQKMATQVNGMIDSIR